MNRSDALAALTADPSSTGVFCDFDGTLSPIVDDPGDARPVAGAVEVLERLAGSFGVVAVVSGRSLDDLRSRVAPTGVVLAGSYGAERSDGSGPPLPSHPWDEIASRARAASSSLDGVAVERKEAGVAVHFRGGPEHVDRVLALVGDLARTYSLEARRGRMVVELVPPGMGKGAAVRDLAGRTGLRQVLVVGDDVGDLDAFREASVKVAVRSDESPAELLDEADLVVDGPAAVVALLEELARRPD